MRLIFRLLLVAVAFAAAAVAALVVLLLFGALWVGNELRAAAPDNPLVEIGAPWLGGALFTVTVLPALTGLPALLAVIVGEVLRIRSVLYYVLASGASLAAIPLLAGAGAPEPSIPAGEYMAIFATAGFAGGFIYWLLAGSRPPR